MIKKSVLVALTAAFLFHTPVMAMSSDAERDILSDHARNSTPAHSGTADSTEGVNWRGNEAEEVSAEDWQREILAGNAKRSTPMQKKPAKSDQPAEIAASDKDDNTDKTEQTEKTEQPAAADATVAKAESEQAKANTIEDPSAPQVPAMEINDGAAGSAPSTEPAAEPNGKADTEPALPAAEEKRVNPPANNLKEQPVKKDKPQTAKTDKNDWEREILSGKAQRSIPKG